jgi:hypothetical protein
MGPKLERLATRAPRRMGQTRQAQLGLKFEPVRTDATEPGQSLEREGLR